VPAAAVIPAPRAYTNIAAVKTLVVCLRACRSAEWPAGCPGGLWPSGHGFCLGGPGFNPRQYVPAPNLLLTVRTAPAKSLLQCRPKRLMPPTLATDTWGPGLVPGRYPVRHRSPPSLTPWKTQCAQSTLLTAECPSMECQGTDRVWHWSCAGLGAHSGQPGGCSRGTIRTCFPLWGGLLPGTRGLHPPIVNDGTVRGERYCNARGEILRSLQDPLQRRRSASACPSIKNESPGSKDDQTPS